MAKLQKYDGLSASELSRITRERGLEKPKVLNTGEWAAWLREQDNPTPQPKAEAPSGDGIPTGPSKENPQMEPETLNFESMTVEELRDLAEARGVDLQGAKRKAEIIDALEGAAG